MNQHTELRLELTKNLKWNGLLGVWLIKHHELIGLIERAADALQALERVPDVEALIDDLSEWSRHVVEDTAHESLEKHVKRVLAHHGITPPESKG